MEFLRVSRRVSAAPHRVCGAVQTDKLLEGMQREFLAEVVYAAMEDEAQARSVRDPDDWPVVAYAMVLNAAVWTNDNDFLGTGVATWTTNALDSWLKRNPEELSP
ncbi:PIN domain-containing protein [Candidatus Poriferisodalis sp.]|uniref:PIN domain-containing protein n=1 Tax=Candidatus Poriferisodalis sp. TaxID=3101277 RepID=UPI003C703A16